MDQNQSRISTGQANYGVIVEHNSGMVTNYFYNEITRPEVSAGIQNESRNRERARECLRLFKTTNYEAHKDFNRQRHPGTCTWVLQHPQFRHWRQVDRSSLLWFSADAGCGKSVLSRFLVDSNCLALGRIYYFFFGDSIEQNNLVNALCAILHQLFTNQPHLLSHAVISWEQNGDYIQREPDTLWRILCAAASDPACRPITCIFDAIDECIEPDRCHLLHLLYHFFSQLSPSKSYGKLKLFISSRLDDGIERSFQRLSSFGMYFRLHSENAGDQIHSDIMLVIRDRVDELTEEFSLSDESRIRLIRNLQQIEYRTFLGLDLVLKQARTSYQDSFNPNDVQIDQLPSSVEEIYERMLSKITGIQINRTRIVLLAMLGTNQPFTIQNLSLALALLSPGFPNLPIPKENEARIEKQIRRWCGHLVVINNSRVHLIHKTVRDFLICPDDVASYGHQAMTPSPWRHSMSMVEAHQILAVICQKARAAFRITPGNISESTVVQANQRHSFSEQDSLECYASNYELYHMLEALRRMHYHHRNPFVSSLFSFGIDLQSIDSAGRSLLHYMTHCYHRNIDYGTVTFLLEQGGLVQSTDKDRFNCLQYAALRNDGRLLRILLKAGFKVDQQKLLEDTPKRTKLLADRAYDLNHRPDFDNFTALQIAASFGQAVSVSILLQHGANFRAADRDGRTALHMAVSGQYNPMFTTSKGQISHVSPHDCYASRMQCLWQEAQIKKNASINRAEIVKMLCKKSPSLVHARNCRGRTPLHEVTCSSTSLAVFNIMTLLEYGADPRVGDNEAVTPIHLAAFYGNLNCLKLLMTKDDDISKIDDYGWTMLHFATIGGNHSSCSLEFGSRSDNLGYRGAEFPPQEVLRANYGGIGYSNAYDAYRIVEFLLEHGSQASHTNHCGQDALALYIMTSSCYQQPELVTMLLKNGANPNFKDAQDRNLGHLYLSGESITKLDTLVALQFGGVCLSDLDGQGRSALHHLAMSDWVDHELLYHLRSCVGIDVCLRDVHDKTAEDYAHESRTRHRYGSKRILEDWDEAMAKFRTMPCVKEPCICRSMSTVDRSVN